MRLIALLCLAVGGSAVLLSAQTAKPPAQTRKPPVRRAPPPPPPPPVTVAPEMTCPATLGVGVKTQRAYCDVMSGRDPAGGILISIPPHQGPVTLTFDLHNRHTYSEELVKSNRAYARYTAVIGALTMDNTLISRAAIQSEFRRASDLVERIGGGVGPGGVKAVAPIGTEPITITIPAEEDQVSLLGEKLIVDRAEGPQAQHTSSGYPVAIVSNVMIEYTPPPPPKPTRSGTPGRAGRSGK
jgi:hypothetical protein